MSVERIIALKRARAERKRVSLPGGDPASLLSSRVSEIRDFSAAVKRAGRLSLIAEVKKASPSRGVIREDFDPAEIAGIYRERGVDAVSVLTEEEYFMGSPRHIDVVRAEVPVPVLKKDFIVDELQIFEAVAEGADSVLLIAFILSPGALARFVSLCGRLGIAPLVEVHGREDVEKASDAGAVLFGINNRDLTTFEVDLSMTEKLAGILPAGAIAIGESGIRGAQDVQRMKDCGVDGVLVGGCLMESADIGAKLDELMEVL